jgi:hypothetical protein
MKQGKRICETLKAIRNEIACANEIDYTPTPCHHEGDCAGTCPKCESETRWLERQLRARQALGKAVTIAGLTLALGAMSSCTHVTTPPDAGDVPNTDSSFCTKPDTTTCTVKTYNNENDVDGYLDDSDTTFTPLHNGKENVSPKGNDDEEDLQVMGEVAVDEKGNIGNL